MKFVLFLFCCGLSLGAAMAQSPAQEKDSNALERSKIAAERARLEAGFQAEEAACKSRFAVNACLQEIRPRRNAAMADLRRQDLLINEAERKARGADQIQKTEDKSSLERQQQRAEQEKKAQQETERAQSATISVDRVKPSRRQTPAPMLRLPKHVKKTAKARQRKPKPGMNKPPPMLRPLKHVKKTAKAKQRKPKHGMNKPPPMCWMPRCVLKKPLKTRLSVISA